MTNHLQQTIRYVVSKVRRHILRETASSEHIDKAATEFRNTLDSALVMRFNGRFERGIALAKKGAVVQNQNSDTRLFKVNSANQSRPPYHYLVDLDAKTCECPEHQKGHFCKHRVASHIIELANQSGNGNKPAAQPDKESIIWAVLQHDGKYLGVEVLFLKDDQVVVRALPKIVDGRKLLPQFPFEGKLCTTRVPKEALSHVKVFR